MYFDRDSIWEEVDRILLEDKKHKFTPGQNIWYNLNFFCNPKFFFDPYIEQYIQEYFLTTKFNIPLSKDLSSADARTLDIFRVIGEEMTACEHRSRELNNGK